MSTRPCHIEGCPGTEIEEETEYGSLAAGGSYEGVPVRHVRERLPIAVARLMRRLIYIAIAR